MTAVFLDLRIICNNGQSHLFPDMYLVLLSLNHRYADWEVKEKKIF